MNLVLKQKQREQTTHRHVNLFAWKKTLLLEAEALYFIKINRSLRQNSSHLMQSMNQVLHINFSYDRRKMRVLQWSVWILDVLIWVEAFFRSEPQYGDANHLARNAIYNSCITIATADWLANGQIKWFKSKRSTSQMVRIIPCMHFPPNA